MSDSYDHLKRQYDEIVERQKSAIERDAEKYRVTLQTIVDVYDMRADLFTSDEDLAANLYDRARKALQSEGGSLT